MKKILITGGLGFVGGRLTRKLMEQFDVVVSSRTTCSDVVLKRHGNPKSLLHERLLHADTFPEGIDTVIHLAALNEWDCIKFPSEAIAINIDQTRCILENAMHQKVQRFIYFSTAHIYGSPLQGYIDEQTLPVPLHPYAITHKAAEDYIIAAAAHQKIQGYVFRLSNSFGAPVVPTVNRWTLLANDLCRQAIEKGSLTLLSNGCQYRDFICLTDVENAVNQLLMDQPQKLPHGIYNLGAGVSMQVIEMARLIAETYEELFGSPIALVLPPASLASQEPELVFSNKKLLQAGILLNNQVKKEIVELLLFCQQNFKRDA